MWHGVVVHVTLLLIVAYFILYTASKAGGLVGVIGKLLSLWVFALAVLVVICMTGPGERCGFMDMMKGHMGNWMHGPEQPAEPAPAPTPAPAPSPQAQPSSGGTTPPKT
jgi:hypothetical protein